MGTFKSLLETTEHPECFVLQTVEFPVQANLIGYRAPFYSRDATRFYRCRAQTRRINNTDWDPSSFRTCCLTEQDDFGVNATETRSFLAETNEGKLWLEAIHRIDLLHSHAKRRRSFYSTWDDLIPSIPATRAFPDVNAHVFQSPKRPQSIQVLRGRNGIVERNGRTIFATSEVFYPQRAPYSHIALLETWLGGASFKPSINQRVKFSRQLDAAKVIDCLAKVISPDKIYTCDDDKVAVDTVLVISQTLGNEMFHFLCEGMPRLGALLPFLLRNPHVFIHITCPEKHGYCLPLFDLLGIARSRLVRDKVVAKNVLVPEGGRRHWPIANLPGLLALREQVLTYNFASREGEQCFTDGKRIRIALMKRKKTRLSEITSNWYNRFLARFQNETSWQLQASFGLQQVEFVLYDDADQVMMKDAKLQIEALRQSDIIVGAHGAAFSWMTYLKRCSHFISFRSRTNSDIFEQLAAGLGMGFHHVRFENEFDSLFEQLQSSIFVAVQELIALRQESLPAAFTVVLCETCSREVIQAYLVDFPAIVTRTLMTEEDADIGMALNDEAMVQAAKRLFPQVTAVLWVNGNQVVRLAEGLFERWIPKSRFDVVTLSASLTAKPKLVLFNDLLLAEDFTYLPKNRAVAVIVSPFSAAKDLEYVVPKTRQSEFLARFGEAERFGAHYLQQQQNKNEEFGIMISRNGETWWRGFPPHAFVREPATADTFARAGTVIALKLPFD